MTKWPRTDWPPPKPGEVWVTTDGTPVYVRQRVDSNKRGHSQLICSTVEHTGDVSPVSYRWAQEDQSALAYPVPIEVNVSPVGIYLGRVTNPHHYRDGAWTGAHS